MKRNNRFSESFAMAAAAAFLILTACAAPKPKVEEAMAQPPFPATADSASATATETANVTPPKVDEVKEAVSRVFKDAALISTDRKPPFVAGDFNGDQSLDIAVVLRPAPDKLAEVNQDYPPWILKNIFSMDRPGSPRLRIDADETLLAVIHGYGAKGWRDPEARQTFLLKSAAGSEMQTNDRSNFLKANQGKQLPRVRGDVIRQVLKGKTGWIYYAEAGYKWYDPDTFKPEPERRVVQPGFPARVPN
jgi:hypothetical protein